MHCHPLREHDGAKGGDDIPRTRKWNSGSHYRGSACLPAGAKAGPQEVCRFRPHSVRVPFPAALRIVRDKELAAQFGISRG